MAEAKKKKIKVFAWVNVLSLAQNNEAGIINKFGKTVLTKDQHLMTPLKGKKGHFTDKYYIKEKQLFLEPGDPRVREYVLAVIDEVMERYPGLSGIHLDYIRYPNAIPYLPDSRFSKYGLSYGYGERNIRGFRQATGIDPMKMGGERYECLSWDNWKRGSVTTLVKEISRRVREKYPDSLISCAVIPSLERAYSIAFQDWSLWLEEGIVDFVVLMNYTVDNRLAKETAKSALAHRGQGRVYIGIGAFLMKDKPNRFAEQYKETIKLDPDGIVFFSYDEMTGEMLNPL